MAEKKPVYRMMCAEDQVNASIYAQIYDFYESNRHTFNAERDPMVLLDSLRNGSAVYILNPDEEIVASSLTFRYGSRHTETGGTRVIKNGFGLQRVMKWYQVVNDHLFRPPEGIYFAVVAKDNAASKANIERCGFIETEISEEFLFDLGIADSSLGEKAVFSFDDKQLPYISEQLLAVHREPVIKNKRSGEEIVLRIEGNLCRNAGLVKILENLAANQ